MAEFHGNQKGIVTFRRKLAKDLIHNELDQEITQKHTRTRSNKRKYIEHSLQSIPPYSKFIDGIGKKSVKEKTSKNFVQLSDAK